MIVNLVLYFLMLAGAFLLMRGFSDPNPDSELFGLIVGTGFYCVGLISIEAGRSKKTDKENTL